MDSNVADDVEPQRRVCTADEADVDEDEDWPRDRSHSWITFDEEAKRGDEAWWVSELKAFFECHVRRGCVRFDGRGLSEGCQSI